MDEDQLITFRHNVLNAVKLLVPKFENLWKDQVKLLEYYQQRFFERELGLLFTTQDVLNRRRNGKTTIIVAILAAILTTSEKQIVLVMDLSRRSRERFIGLLKQCFVGAQEMTIVEDVAKNRFEITSGTNIVYCAVTKQPYESLDFW